MKYLLLIIFTFCTTFSTQLYELECDKELLILSESIGLNEVGVIEKRNNRGEVEKYLHAVGLQAGNPYCAAGQYWCFKQAANRSTLSETKIPFPRSGLANRVFDIAAKIGNITQYRAYRHSFLIWRKGITKFGHIERIVETGKAGWVKTLAFNVKFTKHDETVEGVAIKRRNIYHPIGRLSIRGIVRFKGV